MTLPPTPIEAPLARPAERLAVARVLVAAGRDIEALTQGRSMGGTIPAGATIRIRGVDPASLHAGDVVAFVIQDALITHRLVARGRGPRARHWLITRGDAARVCDAPLHEGAVLGLVTAFRAGAAWSEIAAAPATGGWNRVVVLAAEGAVRVALELDAGLAGSLVRQIRSVGRAGARATLRSHRRKG